MGSMMEGGSLIALKLMQVFDEAEDNDNGRAGQSGEEEAVEQVRSKNREMNHGNIVSCREFGMLFPKNRRSSLGG